jgi:hypothetical protein
VVSIGGGEDQLASWVIPVAASAGACCIIALVAGGVLVYRLGQRNAARAAQAKKDGSTEMVTAREGSSARGPGGDYGIFNPQMPPSRSTGTGYDVVRTTGSSGGSADAEYSVMPANGSGGADYGYVSLPSNGSASTGDYTDLKV